MREPEPEKVLIGIPLPDLTWTSSWTLRTAVEPGGEGLGVALRPASAHDAMSS
jgi:hypothetical protein